MEAEHSDDDDWASIVANAQIVFPAPALAVVPYVPPPRPRMPGPSKRTHWQHQYSMSHAREMLARKRLANIEAKAADQLIKVVDHLKRDFARKSANVHVQRGRGKRRKGVILRVRVKGKISSRTMPLRSMISVGNCPIRGLANKAKHFDVDEGTVRRMTQSVANSVVNEQNEDAQDLARQDAS